MILSIYISQEHYFFHPEGGGSNPCATAWSQAPPKSTPSPLTLGLRKGGRHPVTFFVDNFFAQKVNIICFQMFYMLSFVLAKITIIYIYYVRYIALYSNYR